MAEVKALQESVSITEQVQVEVRKQITLLLPDETRRLMAELMKKADVSDEAELFSLALGVLEFALWAKEQGWTVVAVDDKGNIKAEMEW
ncbi:MAG: hypothetical protein SLRJCFUN_000729 [Candidatus Fervidibacter sp.]|jgi:uncharacterized small protein (DUF1192 family)